MALVASHIGVGGPLSAVAATAAKVGLSTVAANSGEGGPVHRSRTAAKVDER
jgi:hypothetical protein